MWISKSNDTKNIYSKCQSCGMPFSRDPKKGGTAADGSISKVYCSHCYAEGQFLKKNITAAEMQQFVKEKLMSFGFPRFLAWIMTLNIPKLKRWEADNH